MERDEIGRRESRRPAEIDRGNRVPSRREGEKDRPRRNGRGRR